MEKRHKKGHPLPTKVVDEPSYKRPLHGFCYTHFNMEDNKNTKLFLTVEQVHYINTIVDEPLFVINNDKLTFKPINEKRFQDWLESLGQGDK